MVTALAVATILFLFAAAFLTQLQGDHHAARVRQRATQARWNARSGLERYRATGVLPHPDPATGLRSLDLGPRERCLVRLDGASGDICFEGVSGGSVRRTLRLVGGDPARLVWEVP